MNRVNPLVLYILCFLWYIHGSAPLTENEREVVPPADLSPDDVLGKVSGLLESQMEEEAYIYLMDHIRTFWMRGSEREAQERLEEAVSFFEMGENKAELARAYHLLATVLHDFQQFDTALEYFEKSLKIKEYIGDELGRASTFGNMGIVHFEKGDLEKALEYYIRSRFIFKRIGSQQGEGRILNNIGLVYQERNELDRALDCYQQALSHYMDLGLEYGIASTCNNIGGVHELRGECERALDFYKLALERSEKANDQFAKAKTCYNLGHVLAMLGEKELAEDLLTTGMGLFMGLSNDIEAHRCKKLLEEVRERL